MDKYILKFIAACEVTGALLGAYVLYRAIRSAHYDSDLIFVFFALICALSTVTVLALIAGILLWTQRRLGLGLSLLVQILQVPLLTSAILKFQLMFGVGIWVYLSFDERIKIGLPIKFGAAENITWNPDLPFSIGVNVLALYFIYVLLRAMFARRETLVSP
jgi:hypothetical protein